MLLAPGFLLSGLVEVFLSVFLFRSQSMDFLDKQGSCVVAATCIRYGVAADSEIVSTDLLIY